MPPTGSVLALTPLPRLPPAPAASPRSATSGPSSPYTPARSAPTRSALQGTPCSPGEEGPHAPQPSPVHHVLRLPLGQTAAQGGCSRPVVSAAMEAQLQVRGLLGGWVGR